MSNGILYHYCPTSSFHGIVHSRSLWLSSLSLANDTMEGRLVALAIARVAKKDSLSDEHIARLVETVGIVEKIIDGFGFCLSEDGDLLSQWRGYAADATGVAIGFRTEYVDWLSNASKGKALPGITLQQVTYDLDVHDAMVEPTYREVKGFIEAGAFKIPRHGGLLLGARSREDIEREREANATAYRHLAFKVLTLFPELFKLKGPAFREEREWRLLSYFTKGGRDQCSHRVVQGRIVPFRVYELLELERKPIAEVILGPKHGTPAAVVEDFLNQNEFAETIVRRSEASYR